MCLTYNKFFVPICRKRILYIGDYNVGARKARNIRDNIFVINTITNSVVNGKEEGIDLQVYDVEKCFDALWLQECINDVFEAGLQNDKLPLLFLENANAQIAVKTLNGISRRENITNIIMPGSVWGSLLCTTRLASCSMKVKTLCTRELSLSLLSVW